MVGYGFLVGVYAQLFLLFCCYLLKFGKNFHIYQFLSKRSLSNDGHQSFLVFLIRILFLLLLRSIPKKLVGMAECHWDWSAVNYVWMDQHSDNYFFYCFWIDHINSADASIFLCPYRCLGQVPQIANNLLYKEFYLDHWFRI